jgi:diguanylate cyclase (GGDEF)-like protein
MDAGRVFRLEGKQVVLGRGPDADIRIDDEAVSRYHARVVRQGDDGYAIEDLDSTNGTYVNGRPVRQARLHAGTRVQLGPHVSFRFALLPDDEDTLQRRLYESSVRDGLTGVLNRASLVVRVEDAVQEALSRGTPLAILLIDLDHFKQVNDQLGHAAGDELLRAVADRLVRDVRVNDCVARYGGEEFVIVARETTFDEARNLAERLRASVASLQVQTDRGVALTTASVGVASLAECEACTGDDVLRLADARMYEAKRNGRNRVWPS